MNNPYFESELRHLHEALSGFSKNDDLKIDDPSVERLLEGVAYLSAEMKRSVSEGQSKISEALLAQIAPELLQPIPSNTILELKPRPGQLLKKTVIKQDSMVRSRAINEVNNTDCQFTLNEDCIVRPIEVSCVEYHAGIKEKSQIIIQMRVFDHVDIGDVLKEPLVFFINAEYKQACELYRFLTQSVNKISYRFNDQEACDCLLNKPLNIIPNNFTHHRNQKNPFENVKSFFAFPEQYFFVALTGLNKIPVSQSCKKIKLVFHSDLLLSEHIHISEETFKINCVTVANQFESTSEPIILNSKQIEYPLIPSLSEGSVNDIHSIKEVAGISPESGIKHIYNDIGGVSGHAQQPVNYQKSTRMDKDGLTKQYLQFSFDALLSGEIISCLLSVTNANLPYLYLTTDEIFIPCQGVPDCLMLTNIKPLTQFLLPPTFPYRDWSLIGHLSLRLSSLCNVDYFKLLLSHLDWSNSLQNKRYIDSVQNIKTEMKQTILKGVGYPLLCVFIEIDKSLLSSDAEIYILGEIISSLFGGFIQMNIRYQLTLLVEESTLIFDMREGWKKTI